MKKLLSVIVLAAVVMSIAVIGSSAAEIYMQDDFSGGEINTSNWIAEGTKFFVEDGMLQGYKDAVIQQSAFGNPDNGQEFGNNRNWKTFAGELDVRIVETDSPGAHQGVGIWMRAYGDDFMDGENAGQIYCAGYDHTNSAYFIQRADSCDATSDTTIVSAPTEQWAEGADAPFHKIGVKVEANGVISLWADGKKVIEADTSNAANTGSEETIFAMGTYNTPFLLVNRNNFVQLDNVLVASPDHYSETVAPNPDDTNNNGGDTGNNGGDTGNNGGDTGNNGGNAGNNGGNNGNNGGNAGNNGGNSNPNATDTNKNQNGAASTGDALYIAVAVAVVALGSAIVVKKVNAR